MTTCGTPWSSFVRWPPKIVYHVCECTRSTPSACAARRRSTDIVCSAGLASASAAHAGERMHPGRRTRLAEAANLEVDPLRELPGQVFDVDAGAAVDLGRELAGEEQGLHRGRTLPSRAFRVRRSRSYTRGRVVVKTRQHSGFAGVVPVPHGEAWPRPRGWTSPDRLDAGVDTLAGVGPTLAKRLRALGIESRADLLFHRPRRYERAADESRSRSSGATRRW